MDIPFLRVSSAVLTLFALEIARQDPIPFLQTPLASSSNTAHSWSPPPMTFLTFSFNGSSSILLITPKAFFFQSSTRNKRFDQLCTTCTSFRLLNLTKTCEAASRRVSACPNVNGSVSIPTPLLRTHYVPDYIWRYSIKEARLVRGG